MLDLLNVMMRLAYPQMASPAKWLRTLVWARVFYLSVITIALSALGQAWQVKANWSEAAGELVRKAMERAGRPSAISISFSNASALSNTDVNEVRRAIESQLSARSIRVVRPEQALAELRITLSENPSALLWVADIRSGTKREVVMTEVAKSEAPTSAQLSPALTLHKELVWSQYDAILDFALWGEGRSRLLVLEPRMVSLYRLINSRWTLEQSQPISRSTPLPADVRGRLLLLHDQKFEVFIPGQHCTGTADAGLTLECRQADDPWPLAGENSPRAFFSATRNFFTGVMTAPAPKTSAPFFSAATVQAGGREAWIFAGTDGRARLFDSAESELRVPWGSALTGVKSGCGSGWQLLAAGTGDWTQRDLLHAFELTQGATPATPAVEVSGPVTALWAAADGSTASVVARNLANGKYEAFSFSIGCR